MQKTIAIIAGTCTLLFAAFYLIYVVQKSDKEEMSTRAAYHDRDLLESKIKHARTSAERKYLKERASNLDKEIQKAEERKAEAERLEKESIDGVKEGLKKAAGEIEKAQNSNDPNETEALRKKLGLK